MAIECQGKGSHGRAGDGLRDADRMTALQAMGYDVFLLTHGQISDDDRFHAIVKAVCRLLDVEYRDKSLEEHYFGLSYSLTGQNWEKSTKRCPLDTKRPDHGRLQI